MKLDAKTITAVAGLVAALAGGVELRVQVGLIQARLDRLESRLDHDRSRVASVSREDR